jgi:hypothetical protein
MGQAWHNPGQTTKLTIGKLKTLLVRINSCALSEGQYRATPLTMGWLAIIFPTIPSIIRANRHDVLAHIRLNLKNVGRRRILQSHRGHCRAWLESAGISHREKGHFERKYVLGACGGSERLFEGRKLSSRGSVRAQAVVIGDEMDVAGRVAWADAVGKLSTRRTRRCDLMTSGPQIRRLEWCVVMMTKSICAGE